MKQARRTTTEARGIPRLLRILPILAAGIVLLCFIRNTAATLEAPGVQASPPKASAASAKPLEVAARKKVLTMLLDQLQQRARESEASLKLHRTATDEQAPVLLADVQALHEQIQTVQQELDQLTPVGPGPGPGTPPLTPAQRLQQIDQRIQQLTQQREDLARTAQQLALQLQQLPPGQEPSRGQLQSQIARIQEQLRTMDAQLTELRRERLRADYEATLQGGFPGPAAPPSPAPQTAKELADFSAQLQQLQDQVQRNQQELEQLQDRNGPRARELEAAIEGLRQQIQALQDRLRQTEQTQAAEKIQAAERQRQAIEACVQQLDRGQKELTQSIAAVRQELRSFQDQMRQMEQARTTGEESVRRTAQEGLEQLRAETAQQQGELRNQIRSVDERLKAAAELAGTGTQALRQELNRLRADMQRLGQTLARVERERLDAQAMLQGRLQQLEAQVSELRKDVAQVQGSFNMLLSQMGRSTVGSAGCYWGW